MKLKYYKILLVIVVLNSCDVAELSENDSNNISKLKANIIIEEGTKDTSLDGLKVLLSNGKKQIINEKIKILLNGEPMNLFVKNDLYYTKKSFYRTDSLSRNDSYYFEIILPDSTKYPLAYIAPEKKKKNAKFNIPEKVSKNENFILKWTDLKTPYTLEIIKGIEVKKKKAKNITEYGYKRIRMDTLRLEAGEYMISKSYFEDSLTIASHLNLKLTYREYGLINHKLLKGSNITYDYTLKKAIDIEKEANDNKSNN